MEKREIEKLFNDLGHYKIDDLYVYSCLLCSGFNKDDAYRLITLLEDLWIKDENNYSISKLSDMLYNVHENYDIDTMNTRELLVAMYEHENDYEEEIL